MLNVPNSENLGIINENTKTKTKIAKNNQPDNYHSIHINESRYSIQNALCCISLRNQHKQMN